MSKKVRLVIIIACALFVLAATGIVAWHFIPHSCVSKSEVSESSNNTNIIKNPIDFNKLQEINPDIYAWITIPDTRVDYAILQSSEEENFYLDHNEKKESSANGAIYSQKQNSKDFTDPVTVLYGHNMLNGDMFATLHKFEDRDFFDTHDTFYIYTPNKVLTYKIINEYVYDNRHILNSFDFAQEDVKMRYFNSLCNPPSLDVTVREGVSLSSDDKVVQLSTCLGDSRSRFLVTGVLTDVQESTY